MPARSKTEILDAMEHDLGSLDGPPIGATEEEAVVWLANEIRAVLTALMDADGSFEAANDNAMELVALRSICIDGNVTDDVVRELAIEVSR